MSHPVCVYIYVCVFVYLYIHVHISHMHMYVHVYVCIKTYIAVFHAYHSAKHVPGLYQMPIMRALFMEF
jgi:hypothetical protein